jgi:hypothetical protein
LVHRFNEGSAGDAISVDKIDIDGPTQAYAVDAWESGGARHLVVGGSFRGEFNVVPDASPPQPLGPKHDGFLAAYRVNETEIPSTLDPQWALTIHGLDSEVGDFARIWDVAHVPTSVDKSKGTLFVVGDFSTVSAPGSVSAAFYGVAGPVTVTSSFDGSSDPFIGRITLVDGVPTEATFKGTPMTVEEEGGWQSPTGVAARPGTNVYVSGHYFGNYPFAGQRIPQDFPSGSTVTNQTYGFVASFKPDDLAPKWIRGFGDKGSYIDPTSAFVHDVTLLPPGDPGLIVVGTIAASKLDLDEEVDCKALSTSGWNQDNGLDGFVVRLDTAGKCIWARRLVSQGDDAITSVAVTSQGIFVGASHGVGQIQWEDGAAPAVTLTQGSGNASLLRLTYDGELQTISGNDIDHPAIPIEFTVPTNPYAKLPVQVAATGASVAVGATSQGAFIFNGAQKEASDNVNAFVARIHP